MEIEAQGPRLMANCDYVIYHMKRRSECGMGEQKYAYKVW